MRIITLPDPILRTKAAAIKEITADVKTLADEMLAEVKKDNALGLAAPQVGFSVRLVALAVERKKYVLVNPKIVKYSADLCEFDEGCLSLPGLAAKVLRPREVAVEAQDLTGKKFKLNAKGLLARVLQHEIDHLDGIVFIDRVTDIGKIRKVED